MDVLETMLYVTLSSGSSSPS